MLGTAMLQILRHQPAPSSSAASYKDTGTSCRPAMRMTTVLPTPQKPISTKEGMAKCTSVSQGTDLIKPKVTVSSTWLSTPYWVLKIHIHTMALATNGVTTGRKKKVLK